MAKRMLINVAEPYEARVAITDGTELEDLYVERETSSKLLGNVYKGRVVSVEPSIQAAFVDFGIDKNGFLHVSDVMPAYGRSLGNDNDGKDMQSLLQVGQEVLVQVTKEEINTKAPTLTTYLSLPGRYMVLMPSVNKRGVSKKIEDARERKKLRAILNELDPPKGMGYIIRTAGADRSRTELVRDLNYLLNLWKAITNRVRNVKSPVAIYQESDLVMRTIRDHLVDEIEEVIVDSVEAYQSAMAFLKEVMPGFAERLRLYNSPKPLFHEYKIEDQVDRLYDRTVPLPSGGSIMIDQTEALVAIDVNSGKSKDKDNLEATALQTNLEAAREICKQLRLRDMGGVICCDFIDLREDRHRQKIENLMRERLSEDRARTRVARMSRFCILELTRQRVRMSIRKIHYHTCSVCNGSGSIKTVQSMALWTVRHLRNKVTAAKAPKKLEVRLHPDVVNRLNQKHAADLKTIENLSGHKLLVKTDRGLKVEEIKFR